MCSAVKSCRAPAAAVVSCQCMTDLPAKPHDLGKGEVHEKRPGEASQPLGETVDACTSTYANFHSCSIQRPAQGHLSPAVVARLGLHT